MVNGPPRLVAYSFCAPSGHARGEWRRAWNGGVLKPREERQKVMIRARMRSGACWHDVCILNLSRRGLGLQAAEPPMRGTYVEICRGSQVVIARVVWTKGHRAGLHAQDPIWIEGLIAEARPGSAPTVPAGRPAERRRAPRTSQQRHDSSRLAGRAMEFACIVIAGAGVGLATVGMVQKAIAQPMSEIRTALGDP